MTPTLRGRWQTRLLLNLTVGMGITALFGYLSQDFLAVFALLVYLTSFGLVWDMLYMRVQARRWEHDWSPALFLVGAGWEVGFLIVLTRWVELPGIPVDYSILALILQYGTIGLLSFFLMFGPMRILFPRWRFRGGQWL